MARLPVPGKDSGTWGDILNDYLSQSLKSNGVLKDNSVGSAQLADDAVGAAHIQDNAVSPAKLQSIPQSKVTNLETELSNKANSNDVNNVLADKLDITDAQARYAPRDEVYFTARGRSDGAISTLVTDSGTPFTLTYVGGSGFVVSSELLSASTGLPYLNFGPLPGDVREFRLTARWTDDGQANDAPAVMVVADDVFHTTNNVGTYANAGGHILIYRGHVNVQKRRADGAGPSGTYFSKTYPVALNFDQDYTFIVRWDGSQLVFILPDGTLWEAGADADVQAWWGPYATVELVANHATENAVQIRDFFVSSRISPESTDPTLRQGRLLYRHETSGSSVTTAIGTSATSLFATAAEVPVPRSRRILIEGALWIEEFGPLTQTAASLYLNIYYGSSAYAKNLTVISGYTPISDGVTVRSHGRQVPFSVEIELSVFVVGQRFPITVRGVASGISLFSYVDSGGAGGFAGIRTSWLNVYEIMP